MCTRVLFTEATRCIQADTENSSSGYIWVACIGTRLIDQHINFFLFSDPSVYECFSKSTASRFSYVHFDIFSPVVALCARLQSELPGESGANPSNLEPLHVQTFLMTGGVVMYTCRVHTKMVWTPNNGYFSDGKLYDFLLLRADKTKGFVHKVPAAVFRNFSWRAPGNFLNSIKYVAVPLHTNTDIFNSSLIWVRKK